MDELRSAYLAGDIDLDGLIDGALDLGLSLMDMQTIAVERLSSDVANAVRSRVNDEKREASDE